MRRVCVIYVVLSVYRLIRFPTQVLNVVAVVFLIVELVMCAQLFWVRLMVPCIDTLLTSPHPQVCEPLEMRNHWKEEKSPQCPLDNQVAICQLVSEY